MNGPTEGIPTKKVEEVGELAAVTKAKEKVQMETECVVSGKKIQLTANDVETRLREIEPEPARSLVVEVNGRFYPVKQAFAEVSGLDRADFISHQARSIFLRLGFNVKRLAKSA